MGKRKKLNLTTKLAAALLRLGEIDYERGKTMSAKEIVACYEFNHHPIPKALGGSDHPSNLTPLLVAAHAHATNKNNGSGRSDKTMIARSKRIVRSRSHPKRKRKIAQPMNFKWPTRKLRGRGFERRPT